MLLLTLRGTPTIYYGDEIGMRDVPIPPKEIQDPQGLNMPDMDLSRDPARTPMQWDDSENAGFYRKAMAAAPGELPESEREKRSRTIPIRCCLLQPA